MVYSSAKYLLGLIDDILDISKIESGKSEISPSRWRRRALHLGQAVGLNRIVFSDEGKVPFIGESIHIIRVVFVDNRDNAIRKFFFKVKYP